MIPKIIHYCWFGEDPKPDAVKACITSWRKYCPDYEIWEWNESNFDIAQNDYCREAYEAKKWAFVADYARLAVLARYGGIYMDTDVEVVKPFDPLLRWGAFLCFERDREVSIGTFGVGKGSPLVKDFLSAYEGRHFFGADGRPDLTTNLSILTRVLTGKYGLRLNGRRQVLRGDVLVLPMEAFIAKSMYTGWIMTDESTYAIHHYMASWVRLSGKEKEFADRRRKYLQGYMRKAEKWLFKLAHYQAFWVTYGGQAFMEKAMRHMIRGLWGGGRETH